jgi:hypothetical protein
MRKRRQRASHAGGGAVAYRIKTERHARAARVSGFSRDKLGHTRGDYFPLMKCRESQGGETNIGQRFARMDSVSSWSHFSLSEHTGVKQVDAKINACAGTKPQPLEVSLLNNV